MRILITGSNGYIGRTLSENLEDYDVTLLCRETVDLLDTNSVNKFFSEKFFDVVIHCASVGGNRLVTDGDSVYEQNINMFNNIVSNKKSFNRLITFGTGAESNPYGLSKSDIRDIVMVTPNFYNIKVFAVFNEDELDRRFIKSNIIRYIKKESMKIHQDKLMDFFYMGDLITLVKYFINNEHPPKEVECSYNIKNTLLDISNMINNLSDYKVPIDIEDNSFGNSYVGNGLFLSDLPLTLIGLEEGIRMTYKNYL
jgi:nucleoside-diphosphate-sugar epimerase